jgi:hypothetical protein
MSLQAQTIVNVIDLDGAERTLALHHCNRNSHLATFRIRRSGKSPNTHSLENSDICASSSGSGDDYNNSENASGVDIGITTCPILPSRTTIATAYHEGPSPLI